MRRSIPNGAAWMKRRAMNRRLSQHLREVDERDLGNRPGIERVFGLDGPEWSVGGCIVQPERVFALLAHSWLTR